MTLHLKLLVTLLTLTVCSCYNSSKIAYTSYGVKKREVYLTKAGVYLHQDKCRLETGRKLPSASYQPVALGSQIKVTKMKTTGNWPMTSHTRVYGRLSTEGKAYRNVLINSVFIDQYNDHRISTKYVIKTN